MKSSALISSLALVVVMCVGGCSSSRLAAYSQPQVTLDQSSTVALGTFEPAPVHRTTTQRAFQLGAGDALGQAIFANYAAIARANAGWQYAEATSSQ
jgi:hypothetical protein